jgi:hypothetical protein
MSEKCQECAGLRYAMEQALHVITIERAALVPKQVDCSVAATWLRNGLAGMYGRETCLWTADEGVTWKTACGEEYVFPLGTPKENGFGFCPYCGRAVRQAEEVMRAVDEYGKRGGRMVFWVCPNGCRDIVDWNHEGDKSVATCRKCGASNAGHEARRQQKQEGGQT